MWRKALYAFAALAANAQEKCALNQPQNGKAVCKEAFGVKMCEIECNDGYTLDDNKVYACAKNSDNPVWQPAIVGDAFPACYKKDDQCNDLAAPENGFIHCELDRKSLDKLCWPQCHQGYIFEHVIPLRGYYRCDSEGWSPSNEIPKCVKKSTIVDDEVGFIDGILDREAVPEDQQGYCMTWGEHHYRTFDGRMYRFGGKCSYILAADGQSFSVTLHNDKDCDGTAECKRTLSMSFNGFDLNLGHNATSGIPEAMYNDKVLALPTTLGLMSIKKASDYILVRISSQNILVKWDGAENVFIKVDDDMHGKLKGLCGDFDHNKDNDFHKHASDVVDTKSSPVSFANSWAAPGQQCADAANVNFCKTNTDAEIRKASASVIQCSFIMETACRYVVDPTPYFEACREDVCFSSEAREDESYCNAMAAYFRECARHGVNVDWRSDNRCPYTCPTGMEYRSCGPSSPATCDIQNPIIDDGDCIDGCHCPKGKVLHQNKCVTKEECPCTYGNDVFESKARIQKDCNQCVCFSGKWHCTKKKCDGVCSIASTGYTTFDGKDFMFQSGCKYTLLREQTDDDKPGYEIEMNNKDCSGNTCARSLFIRSGEHSIKLMSGGAIVINDGEDTIVPWTEDNISVERINSEFIKVTLANGISVLFNGKDRIVVRSSAELYNKHHGLCGVFDGKMNNEFSTPEGSVETNVIDFAKSWQDNSCDEDPTPVSNNACQIYTDNAQKARELCGVLLNNDFLRCHNEIKKDHYYANCMSEYCKTSNEAVVCSIIATYAMECATNGISMDDWRKNSGMCQVTCASGEEWKECGSSCRQSCATVAKDFECKDQCVAGCQCQDGFVRDHTNKCIPADDCKCEFNGKFYAGGESRVFDCNVCECHKGAWFCTENQCEHSDECKDNQMYSLCMDNTPLTCSNMHLPTHKRRLGNTRSHCQPGCVCVKGTVFNEETKECVKAVDCPCHHGGRSYKNGEKIKQECEDCVCKNSKWECTEKACRAQCRAYGDSHYTTFDGTNFKFQGACDYVFAQAKNGAWRVTVKNEPCGSTGAVCTKSIKFTVNYNDPANMQEISLIKGKPIQSYKGSDKFKVKAAGRWLFLSTKKVQLRWDKGTTVLLRVHPSYKEKVEGLCGDYDGSVGNDMVTSQAIGTNNVLEFGNSWRADGSCEEAKNIVSPCETNAHRRPWAVKTCSQLTDTESSFAKCHQYVDPQPYYENCEFDACACDSGNDCACLCTAIAVYVEECNKFGVHLNWRHDKLCPMQCDGCAGYSPCIQTVPKTCDNKNGVAVNDDDADEGCVEGCACEDGFVLSNDGTKCIEQKSCECINHNGKSYGEGAKIEDQSSACEACYCINKAIRCVKLDCDPPKTTTCEPEILTTTTTCSEPKKCLIKCDQVCHSWRKAETQCSTELECIDGCEDDVVTCPTGYLLRDKSTCVKPEECSCKLPSPHQDKNLAPGEYFNDYENCKRCTCWGNELFCEDLKNCPCKCNDVRDGCDRERGEFWCSAKCQISECRYNSKTNQCSIRDVDITDDLQCGECGFEEVCDDCCCYKQCKKCDPCKCKDDAGNEYALDIEPWYSADKCTKYECKHDANKKCIIQDSDVCGSCKCKDDAGKEYAIDATPWYSVDKCTKYECKLENKKCVIKDTDVCTCDCQDSHGTHAVGADPWFSADKCKQFECELDANKDCKIKTTNLCTDTCVCKDSNGKTYSPGAAPWYSADNCTKYSCYLQGKDCKTKEEDLCGSCKCKDDVTGKEHAVGATPWYSADNCKKYTCALVNTECKINTENLCDACECTDPKTGKKYAINKEWTAADGCTKNKCMEMGGQCRIHPNKDDCKCRCQDKWGFHDITDTWTNTDDNCTKYECKFVNKKCTIATDPCVCKCKDDLGNEYKIDAEWTSKDDKCTKFTCKLQKDKTCKIEDNDDDCDDSCVCKQNGVEYKPNGKAWYGTDKCTKYTCKQTIDKDNKKVCTINSNDDECKCSCEDPVTKIQHKIDASWKGKDKCTLHECKYNKATDKCFINTTPCPCKCTGDKSDKDTWHSADKCTKYTCTRNVKDNTCTISDEDLCDPCTCDDKFAPFNHAIDSEWKTDNPCVKNFCKKIKGKCTIVPETEKCTPPKVKKGEWKIKETKVDGKCCPTYEPQVCKDCDELMMKQKCPEVKHSCNKCQEPAAKCLVAGNECCCPAEYECIDCACPVPAVKQCSPCQRVVKKVDDCNCPYFDCENMKEEPKCPKCCTLSKLGSTDDEGCPMYQCECQNEKCPAGTYAKQVANKADPECPKTTCCTTCDGCIDNDFNNRALDEVFCYGKDSKNFDPCKTYICDPTTCKVREYTVIDPKTECPAKPVTTKKDDKGQFYKYEKDPTQCCGTWKRTPCECCDEAKAKKNCPALQDKKCGKCELKSVSGLIDGTECCCPCEYECVARKCPDIKVTSCRPCDYAVKAVDECGCESVICKPRPAPVCGPCCKLLCAGTDKSNDCPIFECECPDDCPATHDKVIEKDGKCPLWKCCEKPPPETPCTCKHPVDKSEVAIGWKDTKDHNGVKDCIKYECTVDDKGTDTLKDDICTLTTDTCEIPCTCAHPTDKTKTVEIGKTWSVDWTDEDGDVHKDCITYECQVDNKGTKTLKDDVCTIKTDKCTPPDSPVPCTCTHPTDASKTVVQGKKWSEDWTDDNGVVHKDCITHECKVDDKGTQDITDDVCSMTTKRCDPETPKCTECKTLAGKSIDMDKKWKEADPCVEYTCIRNKADQCVGDPKTTKCPDPKDAKVPKGKHLKVIPAEKNKCCDTWTFIPCQEATDEQKKQYCEAPPAANCKECQQPTVGCLKTVITKEGDGICCVSKYECVDCPCEVPTVPKCGCHQIVVKVDNKCGCPTLKCEDQTPTCSDKCCTMKKLDTLDADNCPMYTCQCPNTKCPVGTKLNTYKRANGCPSYTCCDPPSPPPQGTPCSCTNPETQEKLQGNTKETSKVDNCTTFECLYDDKGTKTLQDDKCTLKTVKCNSCQCTDPEDNTKKYDGGKKWKGKDNCTQYECVLDDKATKNPTDDTCTIKKIPCPPENPCQCIHPRDNTLKVDIGWSKKFDDPCYTYTCMVKDKGTKTLKDDECYITEEKCTPTPKQCTCKHPDTNEEVKADTQWKKDWTDEAGVVHKDCITITCTVDDKGTADDVSDDTCLLETETCKIDDHPCYCDHPEKDGELVEAGKPEWTSESDKCKKYECKVTDDKSTDIKRDDECKLFQKNTCGDPCFCKHPHTGIQDVPGDKQWIDENDDCVRWTCKLHDQDTETYEDDKCELLKENICSPPTPDHPCYCDHPYKEGELVEADTEWVSTQDSCLSYKCSVTDDNGTEDILRDDKCELFSTPVPDCDKQCKCKHPKTGLENVEDKATWIDEDDKCIRWTCEIDTKGTVLLADDTCTMKQEKICTPDYPCMCIHPYLADTKVDIDHEWVSTEDECVKYTCKLTDDKGTSIEKDDECAIFQENICSPPTPGLPCTCKHPKDNTQEVAIGWTLNEAEEGTNCEITWECHVEDQGTATYDDDICSMKQAKECDDPCTCDHPNKPGVKVAADTTWTKEDDDCVEYTCKVTDDNGTAIKKDDVCTLSMTTIPCDKQCKCKHPDTGLETVEDKESWIDEADKCKKYTCNIHTMGTETFEDDQCIITQENICTPDYPCQCEHPNKEGEFVAIGKTWKAEHDDCITYTCKVTDDKNTSIQRDDTCAIVSEFCKKQCRCKHPDTEAEMGDGESYIDADDNCKKFTCEIHTMNTADVEDDQCIFVQENICSPDWPCKCAHPNIADSLVAAGTSWTAAHDDCITYTCKVTDDKGTTKQKDDECKLITEYCEEPCKCKHPETNLETVEGGKKWTDEADSCRSYECVVDDKGTATLKDDVCTLNTIYVPKPCKCIDPQDNTTEVDVNTEWNDVDDDCITYTCVDDTAEGETCNLGCKVNKKTCTPPTPQVPCKCIDPQDNKTEKAGKAIWYSANKCTKYECLVDDKKTVDVNDDVCTVDVSTICTPCKCTDPQDQATEREQKEKWDHATKKCISYECLVDDQGTADVYDDKCTVKKYDNCTDEQCKCIDPQDNKTEKDGNAKWVNSSKKCISYECVVDTKNTAELADDECSVKTIDNCGKPCKCLDPQDNKTEYAGGKKWDDKKDNCVSYECIEDTKNTDTYKDDTCTVKTNAKPCPPKCENNFCMKDGKKWTLNQEEKDKSNKCYFFKCEADCQVRRYKYPCVDENQKTCGDFEFATKKAPCGECCEKDCTTCTPCKICEVDDKQTCPEIECPDYDKQCQVLEPAVLEKKDKCCCITKWKVVTKTCPAVTAPKCRPCEILEEYTNNCGCPDLRCKVVDPVCPNCYTLEKVKGKFDKDQCQKFTCKAEGACPKDTKEVPDANDKCKRKCCTTPPPPTRCTCDHPTDGSDVAIGKKWTEAAFGIKDCIKYECTVDDKGTDDVTDDVCTLKKDTCKPPTPCTCKHPVDNTDVKIGWKLTQEKHGIADCIKYECTVDNKGTDDLSDDVCTMDKDECTPPPPKWCIVPGLGKKLPTDDPWLNPKDVCEKLKCALQDDGTTYKVVLASTERPCPAPKTPAPGKYLKKTPAAADACCPTYEELPCDCCDEKTAAASCPAPLKDVKCNKCQIKRIKSLMNGADSKTECCCPAEYDCVERKCPDIKVTSCKPCEYAVKAVDECGCESVICKPRPDPVCGPCCKLDCSRGFDKASGCPLFDCICPDDCPAHQEKKLLGKPDMKTKCQDYECCDKQCKTDAGVLKKDKDTWTENDGCRQCICNDYTVTCTDTTCNKCVTPMVSLSKAKGVCCHDCGCEVDVDGKTVFKKINETWKKGECTECTCVKDKGEQCFTPTKCSYTCSGTNIISWKTFDGLEFVNTEFCEHTISEGKLDSGATYKVGMCRNPKEVKAITVESSKYGFALRLTKDYKIEYDGKTADITKNSKFGDITVTKIGVSIRAFIEDSQVIVIFNPSDNSWSIEATFQHKSKTTGICGIINDNKEDDKTPFDKYKITTDKCDCTVPEPCTPCKESECKIKDKLQCTGCDCLNHKVFDACKAVVKIDTFLASCQNKRDALCKCEHCSVLASYAAECKKHGICIDYKDETCCPSTCTADKVHKSCGPCIQKTCKNKDGYDMAVKNGKVDMNCEACFCPDGLVLDGDKCIKPEDCPCCKDGDKNYTHKDGPWTYSKDKCFTVSCSKECKITPPVPVTCDLKTPAPVSCDIKAGKYRCLKTTHTKECCKDKHEYQCCDCDTCAEDVCAARYPKLTKPKCKKCEKISYVYDKCTEKNGNKCTCVKEMKCVPDTSYTPAAKTCLSCQDKSATVDDEGCPAETCVDKKVSCPDCYEEVKDGLTAEGCPNIKCSRRKLVCPTGKTKKTISKKGAKCTEIECCDPCTDRPMRTDCGKFKQAERFVDVDGCFSWKCKCKPATSANCGTGMEEYDTKNEADCPVKACRCITPVPDPGCKTWQTIEDYTDTTTKCPAKRCICKNIPQRTDCGKKQYAEAITNANGCPDWQCTCKNDVKPTDCTGDKAPSDSIDKDGCTCWSCDCIKKDPRTDCVAPMFSSSYTKASGCIDHKCICPPYTAKTDAICVAEHDQYHESYDITGGVCPDSGCRCRTPAPRTDCVLPKVSTEVAVAGSTCRTHECQCPKIPAQAPACTDPAKVSTTTTVGGCPAYDCVCPPNPPKTDCVHPKVSVQVPIANSACYSQECQCPTAQQKPTCDDPGKEATESTINGCKVWTCVCKSVSDPPCVLPKTVQSATIANSECPGKECKCPPAQTSGQCDDDEELISTTSVVCGTIPQCRCKQIADEVCVLPKILTTIDVPGSTNGCKQKVCRCPPAQTADQCDDDEEIASSTSDVCGSTMKCRCKTIADEVCVAPKTLHSVPVVGSVNGCLKNVCKCPQCVDPAPCAVGLIPQDTKETVCGCTVRKCIPKGCTVENDTNDYISPEQGWISVNKVQLKKCGGECASKTKWDDATSKYAKNCACCSVASYKDEIIQLKNLSDNSTKDHTLKVPVLCSCAVTKCQNDEL